MQPLDWHASGPLVEGASLAAMASHPGNAMFGDSRGNKYAEHDCVHALFRCADPDGHCYLVPGPHPLLGRGAVTATAQAVNTLGLPDPPVYLEVIQMATRRVNSDERYLDIVVRNNAHLSGPPSGTWTNFILATPA